MLLIGILALLAGQVAAPTPADDSASVVFYRAGGIRGALRGCVVREGGRDVAHLSPHRSIILLAPPGRHVYALKDKSSAVSFDLARGEARYVRCEMKGVIARPILEVSTEAEFSAAGLSATESAPPR